MCSMGDLFHEDVPFEYIAQMWIPMYAMEQHTFLILTKRPERMLEFLTLLAIHPTRTPKNIWLGVTAENQEQADERIPLLLQCPAAVRFASIEPMLGPIDLSPWMEHARRCHVCGWTGFDFEETEDYDAICPECGESEATSFANSDTDPVLDWVIVGGETGPGARPMRPDWIRGVRDQCIAADVPFFFKKWGANPNPWCNEAAAAGWDYTQPNGGHLLDGQEWHQWPEIDR